MGGFHGFHMEWCIKNDKIEALTMEYTWNGIECALSVPYGLHGFHTLFHIFHGLHGLHMEWCINYDKIELIPHLCCFNKKSCDLISYDM